MNQKLKLFAMSVVVSAALIGCTKKDDDSSDASAQPKNAAKEIPAENKVEPKNPTTSELVEISEGKYAVLPPSVQMKGISVANNPVKSSCKEISKLQHEIQKLEEEKAKTIEMTEHDNSAEAAVDDIAAEIDSKSQALQEISEATATQTTSYDKAALFANYEALKAANPDMSFELAEPKTAVLTIENANRKASASQSIDLSKSKVVGSFSSQDREVKMTLNVKNSILCSYKGITAGQDQLILSLK